MAELFIELFSEEIPARLQIDARQKIKQMLEERMQKKEIKFDSSKSFSTPKRLVFIIDGVPEKIEQKEKVLKGPKGGTQLKASVSFISSHK
jgi:glycyl-tRNA synthetase beta chain